MGGLLLRTDEEETWKQQLDAYDQRIESLNKPDLKDLDHFYRVELPELLQSRKPSAFITTNELIKVVQWKLSRGKWRPRMINFVSSLDEKHVENVSKESFSALPDLRAAITSLSALKGVGPATASAVLAAFAPDVAPFMSDEAMMAVLGDIKDYSLKQYLLFAEKLQTRSKELARVNNMQLTPSDLERALWCAAIEKKYTPKPETKKDDEAPSRMKRKRR